jgi:hypothetical protein
VTTGECPETRSARRTRNGEVRYLQLAHNEWDAAKGRSVPRVIYGFAARTSSTRRPSAACRVPKPCRFL